MVSSVRIALCCSGAFAFSVDRSIRPRCRGPPLPVQILLDRARLSQLNGWTDEAGRIYIIFPIEKIAKMLGKSRKTVLVIGQKPG
ncbi:MAG: replication initiator protein A [Lachnospiraceae bacterium]